MRLEKEKVKRRNKPKKFTKKTSISRSIGNKIVFKTANSKKGAKP